MFLLKIFVTALLVLIPTAAFAWGPFTHMYLGSEVFFLGSLIPPSILGLMRKFRSDFLYGNIMADMVLAKKYLSKEQSCHSWDNALKLYESARTDSERAFSLGYMSHLAADTVAHGSLTAGSKNLHHAIIEMRADSMIDKDYWFLARTIGRRVQRRNDKFLEKSIKSVVFSVPTNQKIFKGVFALTGLGKATFGGVFENPFMTENQRTTITSLQEESLDRILDVLQHGDRSEVLKLDPKADIKPNRFFHSLLS
jgi:hypothetical protein